MVKLVPFDNSLNEINFTFLHKFDICIVMENKYRRMLIYSECFCIVSIFLCLDLPEIHTNKLA